MCYNSHMTQNKITKHTRLRKYFTTIYWRTKIPLWFSGRKVEINTMTIEIDDDSELGRLLSDEKDVKRYRWLREQHWSDNGMAVVSKANSIKLGADCPSDDRLDKMIDENMRKL